MCKAADPNEETFEQELVLADLAPQNVSQALQEGVVDIHFLKQAHCERIFGERVNQMDGLDLCRLSVHPKHG